MEWGSEYFCFIIYC